MKKYSLLIWFVLTNIILLKANPMFLDSICIVQPNNDTLWTCLQGDEFYHWRSTIDGHVIMRDSNNFFRYATIEGDSILRPSEIIAHNIEERTPLEIQYIDLHKDEIKEFIFSEINAAYSIEQNSISNDSILPVQHIASNNSERQPVIGTRKVLTILVEFKDRKFSTTQAEFDSLMNQRIGSVGPNYGSVRQYYLENSYNQLTVESIVIGPININYSYKWYQRKAGENSTQSGKLVKRAINIAKEMVDFSQLDGNNDNFVDCIHVVYAGTQFMTSSTDIFIWPYKSQINPIKSNGIYARDYIITPELNTDGYIAPIGCICHELGHIFGAPDFYNKYNNFAPNGMYDIMCSGNYNGHNIYTNSSKEYGYCPAHHNPYSKCYIFGWDIPKTIDNSSHVYALRSSNTQKGEIYRIDGKTDGEYFLLENRSCTNFDKDIPLGGLLIYHAHKDLDACIEQGNPINSQHPLKFYLVNSSAECNPNTNGESYGNDKAYRAYPGHDFTKTMFTSTTIPSATTWDGRELGTDLCHIKQLEDGSIVSFYVNPQISGPTQLCGTKFYETYLNIPIADSISWHYSTNINEILNYPILRFKHGTEGTVVAIERGYSLSPAITPGLPGDTASMFMASFNDNLINPYVKTPYVGTIKLYATIKGGNGTYQMEKDIVLPQLVTPTLSLSAPFNLLRLNESVTLAETSCSNIHSDYIKWYVRFPNTETEEEYTGHSITFTPIQEGEMSVRVVNDCGCETSDEVTNDYIVSNLGRLSYPNPVTQPFFTVEVERFGGMEEDVYTIEMWNATYGRVRNSPVIGDNVNINVSNLPTGWYQIVLLCNGERVESGNVYITH